MIHQTAHTGVIRKTPEDSIQAMLISRGYHGEYKQAMQEFIRDRIINGQYNSVFSSYHYEPEPIESTEQDQTVPASQKPWYKRLFSRE